MQEHPYCWSVLRTEEKYSNSSAKVSNGKCILNYIQQKNNDESPHKKPQQNLRQWGKSY